MNAINKVASKWVAAIFLLYPSYTSEVDYSINVMVLNIVDLPVTDNHYGDIPPANYNYLNIDCGIF